MMFKLFMAAALACANVTAWAVNANTEWVAGEVVKVDAARSRITLRHERIEMVHMEPMTMPFKVRDVALLKPLKAGDKVRFEVLEHDGELTVQQIEVRP